MDTQCVYFVTHVQNLLFFCCLDTDVQDKKLVVHDSTDDFAAADKRRITSKVGAADSTNP